MISKNTGVVEPIRSAVDSMGAIGLSRRFAAFSQSILDRYAIWEKYPWSDAVIRYLENEKQEEASQKMELSSFFVTMQLLKIYLTNERKKEKKDREGQDTDDAELTIRIETELRKLKTGYDRYFGILERLHREGKQMPGAELSRIWAILEREAGVRRVQKKKLEAGVREVQQHNLETDGSLDKPGIALKVSAALKRGGMTPYSLGEAGIRLRHMAEGHAYIPDSKALFRSSVERQQREFYTKLVKDHTVTDLLLELPAWISRTAVRELLRENIRNSVEKEGTWGGSNVHLSELWERSSQEERKILLHRIPQAVRKAASLWEEADQENGNPDRKKILETMVERIEAVQRIESAQKGETPQGSEIFQGSEAELTEQGILEEVGSILSELPVWVSEKAVRELYSENARGYGTGNEDSETENARFQEQLPALFQDQGESLVYRMENRESVPAESGGAKPEETSLWGSTGQRNGGPRQDKVLKTIVERIETIQRLGTIQSLGTRDYGAGDGDSKTGEDKGVKSRGKDKRTADGIFSRLDEKRENQQLSELWERFFQEEREILLHRIPQEVRQAASLWKKVGQGNSGPRKDEILKTIVERIEAIQSLETIQNLETIQRFETTQKLSDQRTLKEVEHILAELPAWVSKRAVRELYSKNTRDHTAGYEDLETGEDKGTKSRGKDERTAAGVFSRLDEKSEKLQLSELWERSSQEEREILLHRIPQAVRQAASLWEETAMDRMRRPQDEESPEIQMDWNRSQFQYTNHGENVIVYAAKTPYFSDVRQNNEDVQAIQGLENRISRQEYMIRQEQIEMEELQRRLKKQESRENALRKSGNIEITSKEGGNISQNIFSQLKEQFRLERIRYGAD